eukprot:c833_g1_i1 orf=195-350(+)
MSRLCVKSPMEGMALFMILALSMLELERSQEGAVHSYRPPRSFSFPILSSL